MSTNVVSRTTAAPLHRCRGRSDGSGRHHARGRAGRADRRGTRSDVASLTYDLGRKAKLYASFGVRELWVIDAVRRSARIFRRPSADSYAETLDRGTEEPLTPDFAPAAFALALGELQLD